MPKNKVIVIGAGVSGVTTAIVCQLAGFQVKIISKDLPFKPSQNSTFSSLFPAASIIPHSVNFPDILGLFQESESIFKTLYEIGFVGIELHKHFEFFSTKHDLPDYAVCYPTFKLIDEINDSFRLEHPTLNTSFGWYFDCLFADWGTYYQALFELFKKLGGELLHEEIDSSNLKHLDSEVIFNCAEIFGAKLLDESFDPIIYKGHLLHIPNMPILHSKRGQKISYNFTPDLNIYSTQHKNVQDVYFYQRDDRWIFGGSRQKGTIDDQGKWSGEQVINPINEIDGKNIPEQILRLNLEIINQTFGDTEIDINSITSKIGYRFMGNGDEQLRIDTVEIGDKLVINNLGHGGSGVTLSWGCALRCLNLLFNKTQEAEIYPELLSNKLIQAIKD